MKGVRRPAMRSECGKRSAASSANFAGRITFQSNRLATQNRAKIVKSTTSGRGSARTAT